MHQDVLHPHGKPKMPSSETSELPYNQASSSTFSGHSQPCACRRASVLGSCCTAVEKTQLSYCPTHYFISPPPSPAGASQGTSPPGFAKLSALKLGGKKINICTKISAK